MSAFGFEVVAYAGPETGRRDRVSHVLQQGRIRFMVTGALTPDSPIAEHVRAHGDGVRDICFLVDDAEAAYAAALDRGALPERPPAVDTDELGAIHHSAIRTYGETVHTFLDRSGYAGEFAPGFGPPQLPAGRQAPRSASPASTTSSATSRRATSRSGSTTTTTCSASTRSSTSTTTRSRPSTRR